MENQPPQQPNPGGQSPLGGAAPPPNAPPHPFPIPNSHSGKSIWKSKWMKIGLILDLIIIIPVAIFLLSKTQSKAPAPTPTPVMTPTPTPDPTAGWQTFTTTKFSFKYPPTLYVQEPNADFLVLTKTATTPTNLAEFSIDARLLDTYSNYTAAIEKAKEGLTNATTENLTNGIKIKGMVGPGYGEGTSIVTALLKYNQGALVMENSTSPLQETIFDQILSTFKFTDSTASPSPTGQVFCTQEAKLCPDGSYVGRGGPSCEFAPCPIPTTQ